MFCNKCGTLIPNDARFCPGCGNDMAVNEAAQESYSTISEKDLKEIEAVERREKTGLGISILIFSIVGLSLSNLYTALLGLIFTNVARSKLETYLMKFDYMNGFAKAGKIISIFGLIFSILNMILGFIMFFANIEDIGNQIESIFKAFEHMI